MNNNVIIVSGGLDSVVLLHHICKDLNERNVHVLTFDYGNALVEKLNVQNTMQSYYTQKVM